jgi:hypothetical protein
MSFYNINDTRSIKSLLTVSAIAPMATRHSRLWLKLKWHKRQLIG